MEPFQESLGVNRARWALIGDDLTGAADTAVEFTEAGFSAAVCLAPEAVRSCEAELCAVSTETRDVEASAAVQSVQLWSDALKDAGRRLIFKKIDSMLRGNVGAETEELVRVWGFERAAVCPALPRLGRICRDGRVLIEGGRQTAVPVSSTLTAPDAANSGDLAKLAKKVLECRNVLPAGSSGLGAAWSSELGRRAGRSPGRRTPPTSNKPMLCVIGSVHPRTLAQVEYVVDRGIFREMEISDVAGTAPEESVLIRAAMGRIPDDWRRALRELTASGRFGALILSGGATARLVFDVLGADRFDIGGSATEGVPWGAMNRGAGRGLTIATKSGAFGDADELGRIASVLRGEG